MVIIVQTEKKDSKRYHEANCESCEYYDYDEDIDEYVCIMSLDEDEYARFLQTGTKICPYYKFYDEYKSVQKQI